MGKESGNTKWRECIGQRETELCPTEEDGYRGETKVGTTTQKAKEEEVLKNKQQIKGKITRKLKTDD